MFSRLRSSFATGIVLCVSGVVVSFRCTNHFFIGELLNVTLCPGIVISFSRSCALSVHGGALLFFTVRVPVGSLLEGRRTLVTIKAGLSCIGSILNSLGYPIFSTFRLSASGSWSIDCSCSSMLSRSSVFESVSSGIFSLDSLIPLGRGQRELIIGDRQVGKSSVSMDTTLNQSSGQVLCLLCFVGQRSSNLITSFFSITLRGADSYCLLVSSISSASPLSQYMSVYSGGSYCDLTMRLIGLTSICSYDDLSKQALSYREVSLLLRRSPGREAFPGEIFYLHSRLLERSSKLSCFQGSGSFTGLPIIETLSGDVSGFIATNVISITDGQLFLSSDLFLAGFRPSFDLGVSVTRIGATSQEHSLRMVSGSSKLQVTQVYDLQSFSQFSGDLGSHTNLQIEKGLKLLETLKQPLGCCYSLETLLRLQFMSNSGLLDSVPLSSVRQLARIYISIPSVLLVFGSLRVMLSSVMMS